MNRRSLQPSQPLAKPMLPNAQQHLKNPVEIHDVAYRNLPIGELNNQPIASNSPPCRQQQRRAQPQPIANQTTHQCAQWNQSRLKEVNRPTHSPQHLFGGN